MLAIKNNAQIQEEKDRDYEERERSSQDAEMLTVDTGESLLVGHVRSCWSDAKQYRRRYADRMRDCLRRRKGIYDSQKLQTLQGNGQSILYMKLTTAKCKAAKTWLADLFEPAGDRPFELVPKNYPELSPAIKQQMVQETIAIMNSSTIRPEQAAFVLQKHQQRIESEMRKKADMLAEKMSDKIEDTLADAGWKESFDDFLDDIVTYPTAIISGLEYRSTSELSWVQDETGQWVPRYEQKITPKIRRVSPFRFYPSPAVTTTLKGHWGIEHITYTRSDLVSMRKTPGYNASSIAKALLQYQSGGHQEWMWDEDERAVLNEDHYLTNSKTIDALRWSGSISGEMLNRFGLKQADPFEEYQATIEIIGNYVVRAKISPDPDSAPDYYFASFSTVPGSFYGEALPELMADCQDMCNAAARAIADNMQFSSGPMVWINTALMAPGSNYSHMTPWKIFKGQTDQAINANAAIQFFQPQSNVNELMTVFERFSAIADEVTGLPKFAYGSDEGAGAAKTASGLSMLMNASSKSIKHVVRGIDIGVIEKIVKKTYDHEMYFGKDPSIKGDLSVKPKGSQALIHRESMALQQRDLLAMTGNPIDMQILGIEGRADMLKNVMKTSDVNVDEFPTREELQQRMQQAQQQQAQQQQQQAAA